MVLAVMIVFMPVLGASGQIMEGCDCSNQAAVEGDSECRKYCEGDYGLSDFFLLLIRISEFILGIVGSLALLFVVYGGVLFLISGGNKDTVAKGKRAITGAVIGLVLVFLSYAIIHFVMTSLHYNQEHFGGEWNKIPGAQETSGD